MIIVEFTVLRSQATMICFMFAAAVESLLVRLAMIPLIFAVLGAVLAVVFLVLPIGIIVKIVGKRSPRGHQNHGGGDE